MPGADGLLVEGPFPEDHGCDASQLFDEEYVVSTARGHHWVSQTYLARFTADGHKDSKLYIVDLDQRKVFSTTPANVCKQRDFNRVESADLPPDALETGLSQFEG